MPTGSVTQANMRLSIVNGTAFCDFSSASVLTDYLGYRLEISDSAGKKLIGYIKAAGTGETLGSELITTWTNIVSNPFETFTSSGSGITSAIETGADGRARVDTLSVDGFLLKTTYNVTRNSGSSEPELRYSISDTLSGSSIWIDYTTRGANTAYFSGTTTGKYYGYRIESAIDFSATNSLKQVLTPSTTGVTITSTADGSTYNWASEESGFKRNDSSGYTYLIQKSLPVFTNQHRLRGK